MENKLCTECETEKPLSGFHQRKSGKLGRRAKCKDCANSISRIARYKAARKYLESEKGKKWKEKYYASSEYKQSKREYRLNSKYGLTIDEYNKTLENQGGCCAICKKNKTSDEVFPVDHCHETGLVRGILCDPCNKSLGNFKDDINVLSSAIAYLSRNKKINWDVYFLNIANLVRIKSKDPSTQVGAIIVKEKAIISTGFNGLPRGVDDSKTERYERPLKYEWVVHAEQNAILNAARVGVSVEGATIYVTPLSPCVACARLIVNSGISEIVSDPPVINPRWEEECRKAESMVKEAGLSFRKPYTV